MSRARLRNARDADVSKFQSYPADDSFAGSAAAMGCADVPPATIWLDRSDESYPPPRTDRADAPPIRNCQGIDNLLRAGRNEKYRRLCPELRVANRLAHCGRLRDPAWRRVGRAA